MKLYSFFVLLAFVLVLVCSFNLVQSSPKKKKRRRNQKEQTNPGAGVNKEELGKSQSTGKDAKEDFNKLKVNNL